MGITADENGSLQVAKSYQVLSERDLGYLQDGNGGWAAHQWHS